MAVWVSLSPAWVSLEAGFRTLSLSSCSLSLSVTATPTRASESDQDGSLYSLSLSHRLAALASHFPFFFIFFFLCFLLSRFGFGLLRAEFFFFRLTWVMGSALSWLDDGLGKVGFMIFGGDWS